MHEISVALRILNLASDEAACRDVRVVAVHLKLGSLSGVVKEALIRAYELARDGTSLCDSRLVIEDVPIIVHCPNCEADRPARSLQQICCSVCGTPTPHVVSGRELEIVAMEVCDAGANATGGSKTESAETK